MLEKTFAASAPQDAMAPGRRTRSESAPAPAAGIPPAPKTGGSRTLAEKEQLAREHAARRAAYPAKSS